MEWQIIDMQRKEVGRAELPEAVFNVADKDHLFHDVVRWQLAGRRAGTHKAKTRAEVSDTTAKAYRQKGTGRARRGNLRTNVLVGGGRAFPPTPRDYSYKLNRKVVRSALCAALSRLAREKRLFVVEQFALPKPSTKQLAGFAAALKLGRGVFVDEPNETLAKSARNLPRFKYLPAAAINVYDLLKYDGCVISRRALEKINARFAR